MKKIPLYEVREIKDLRDMLQQSVKIFNDKTAFMIKKKRGEAYSNISYKEYGADVDAFGTALLDLAGKNARVAILAETRYEWYVSYLATTNGVGIVIPIDKELPPTEIASLLNRSHANVIIYSSSKQPAISEIMKNLPEIQHYICMDRSTKDKNTERFWDLLEKGKDLLDKGNRDFLDAEIDSEGMSILLFTSGTTDKSKAVMLSHRNICVNLQGMCSMVYIDPYDVFLSVLPIHHTYECTCGFLCPIYRGSTIAQCEGLRYITQNLKESQATVLLAVPLMLEMFHRAIMKKATADPKTKRKFKIGLTLTGALRIIGIDKRRKVFASIHDAFGGKLRMLISGGAGIDPQILSDMQKLGFLCLQGYGLTECAPILALNRDVDFNDKAAGLPLPGVDIKIINADENGIGEIIGKGPNVMLGYYENPEATAEAIDAEGYFYTGDLGYLDENDFVIITGRKKNVIISKNGKNIFPEEIEGLLLRSPFIAEVLVTGEDDHKDDIVVTATIFPNMEQIHEKLGDNPDPDSIQSILESECRNVNAQLATYKQIRKVIYQENEFEKTTSKKIIRKYN